MKKAYQQPATEVSPLSVHTLMTVPSVAGGTGIDHEPGKGDGEAPSGPGAKMRDEDLDPLLTEGGWPNGLW